MRKGWMVLRVEMGSWDNGMLDRDITWPGVNYKKRAWTGHHQPFHSPFVGLISQARHTEYEINAVFVLHGQNLFFTLLFYVRPSKYDDCLLTGDYYVLKQNETSKSFFAPCSRRTTLQRRLAWHKVELPLLNTPSFSKMWSSLFVLPWADRRLSTCQLSVFPSIIRFTLRMFFPWVFVNFMTQFIFLIRPINMSISFFWYCFL